MLSIVFWSQVDSLALQAPYKTSVEASLAAELAETKAVEVSNKLKILQR